ncbi:MAG: hypothetical protein SOX46_05130 [Clostridiaceae bacterium]|uniref:hypothetical protein n=1 Tax=Clostridium sp. TaxID=1506 RepID=UPI0015B6B78C|nr:hypothetical protein [Clostridium sp.]MDY3230946.1 hypothetical protein [Clostridiaceae bacterium]DAV08299.1 MAG TPA: hypothetical protein [Bacteriophage sp.]
MEIPVQPEFNGLSSRTWQGFASKIIDHQKDTRGGIGFLDVKMPGNLDFTRLTSI